jgi:hypothetical protein
LRFRLSPISAVALAARVKSAGKEFVGEQHELCLVEEHFGRESPYERLLRDAMSGDGTLFAREDVVETARQIARDAGAGYIGAGPLGLIGPIARAIMAERERCAQVIQDWRNKLDNRTEQAEGWAAEQLYYAVLGKEPDDA